MPKAKNIQEIFRQLVSEHGDTVYNTALGMVQQIEDAEDITQEVFLKVFGGIEGFRNESQLKTWVYRITINTCIDHLRKNGKEKLKDSHVPELGEFNHPGVLVEQKENAAMLFRAIAKLPDQQKAAFILQKTEGCPVSQVAEILNTSVQATESLLARARQNLKKQLSEYYEQFRS